MEKEKERIVKEMVREHAVVVVSRATCCMSHVVKRLLCALGVNPAVMEIDGREDAPQIEAALRCVVREQRGADPAMAPAHTDEGVALPAVFVGGRLLGGLERLLQVHMSGELIPLLKHAGALWL